MRKYMLHTLCVLFMVLFSCQNEPEITPEITLAKEEMTFSKVSESSILAIKSNLPWTATSSENWCTINPASGEAGTKQITVTVTENTSGLSREATIMIKAGSLEKEVKVIQESVLFAIENKSYNVESQGKDIVINIQSKNSYTATSLNDWVKLKSTSTDNKSQTYTISENTTIISRSGKIEYVSGSIKDTVTINQTGKNLTIPADASGMSSNAKTLAAKMYMGWNLGNTLEATGGETAWGNPVVTQTFIDSVKAAGFNTVRIPCAWNSHLETGTTNQIKSTWLARVKEVVGYCVKNDMYVILNIHWDGGWLEENPTYAKQVEVNAKQKAFWEQIAVTMRDFDEHLLFAGTNEVHFGYGTPTTENINVQLSYNQTFVDAVRSTGGRNTYRNLVIQAYNTNIDQAVSFLKIATDIQKDRLFVEVHYYDPWDFCGETGTSGKSLWGAPFKQYGSVSSWGQEDHVVNQFKKVKTNFVDKGYPVILGEYAPTRRTAIVGDALKHHLDSRAYYLRYVTEKAKNHGIIPCYWDNGGNDNNSSGLFNRPSNKIFDRQCVDSLMKGAANGKYPF